MESQFFIHAIVWHAYVTVLSVATSVAIGIIEGIAGEASSREASSMDDGNQL